MKPKWISIYKYVPDIGIPVLGFCKGAASYCIVFRSTVDWYERETERGIGDLITHWRPLPSPPKTNEMGDKK